MPAEQSGAVEACWAHNPEVRGSKPRSAKGFYFRLPSFTAGTVIRPDCWKLRTYWQVRMRLDFEQDERHTDLHDAHAMG